MEIKKKFTKEDIPGGYAMCTLNDCKVCEHCLRHIAYNDVGKDLKKFMIVNPLLVVATEQCEFFRTDELATYAKGFVRMKAEMLPRQYKVFMNRLKKHFGRTGYYERRRGEKLCSPDDMKEIEAVLKDLGLQHLGFDAYEQLYNWND